MTRGADPGLEEVGSCYGTGFVSFTFLNVNSTG